MEGRKEMFDLAMHSTHFIYGYMAYGKGTIQTARDETCCRHMGYSFRLAARIISYASDRRTHTTAFVTPVVEHWLEREIAQWVHHEGSIRERSYHGATSRSSMEGLMNGHTHTHTHTHVCMYICMYVCIVCMSGLTIHT